MTEKKFDREFISINREFWSRYKEPFTDNILLVETSDHCAINHANAVVGKMIACAKNLRIVWLSYKYTDETLMRSYSPDSTFIKFPKAHFLIRFWFLLLSIFYYFSYVLVINKLCSFKFKRIPYGDFVYDGYLSSFSMATLHRFDFRIIKIFYILLLNDKKARLILSENPIKAILVSHYIGLGFGPLSRVALQLNIPVYWKGGGHEVINLAVFNKLEQIYDYPKKPSKEIIDSLVKMHKEKVESDFKEFISQVDNPSYYGAFSVGYNNVIFSNVTRESFLKNMNLDDKPIIFIMLHAFNDQPHSHFKKMLFNDYCDWFIQTYRFAKNDKSKNWIFKEHPGNKFYKTKDLDLSKMMKNLPGHIRFVSQDSDIRASTVLNVADMIVTCLGSAGVEMPALRRIPAIIASDTFYDGFDFTIEPSSKEEYFEILKKTEPTIILPEQQLRAKCCFIYLNKYCMMLFSAGPPITFEESKTPQKLKSVYFNRILQAYKEKSELIYLQFDEYIAQIKKSDFRSLIKLPLKQHNERTVL